MRAEKVSVTDFTDLPTTSIQEKLAHLKTSLEYETILALKSQFGSLEDGGGVISWVYLGCHHCSLL